MMSPVPAGTGSARRYLATALADALLAGEWTEPALRERAGAVLGRRPRWLGALVRSVLALHPRPPIDRPRELARLIDRDLSERQAAGTLGPLPPVRRWLVPELEMGRMRWPVPPLPSVAELAGWLGLEDGQLLWLADPRGLERTAGSEPLRHYRYRLVPRRSGLPRVIEAPKPRLKALQRRLLHELLDRVPAHPAAHGFTRGRSAITHARGHTGREVVVRIDLEDFFAAVSAARVFGIYRTAGYPEPVAHLLTALCTNAVPAAVLARLATPGADPQARHRLERRLATPHLPQGAPASPALANLAAHALDRRLSGLAAARGLRYSRYADDLTFSGPSARIGRGGELRSAVGTIAAAEGFAVNPAKTTLVTRAGRQRVCGIVVNAHPNLPRADYDRLKAAIHRLGTSGPPPDRAAREKLRAHLEGRVAWTSALHPARGARLAGELAAVVWTPPATGDP
jgi:RNA-directed DNA polymerase